MFAPEKNRTPWYECQIRIVTGRALRTGSMRWLPEGEK